MSTTSEIGNRKSEMDQDFIRRVFLQKLAAAEANGHVYMSEWEDEFVTKNCNLTRFTGGQQYVCDNLFRKYSHQLPLEKSAVRSPRSRVKKISAERAGELFAAARSSLNLQPATLTHFHD